MQQPRPRPPGGSVVVFGAVQTKTVQNHDLDRLWSCRACKMLGRGSKRRKSSPKWVVLGLFMRPHALLEDRAHCERHGSRYCEVFACSVLPEVAPDLPGGWGHACRAATSWNSQNS